jgi:hypothetical protein
MINSFLLLPEKSFYAKRMNARDDDPGPDSSPCVGRWAHIMTCVDIQGAGQGQALINYRTNRAGGARRTGCFKAFKAFAWLHSPDSIHLTE